MSWRLVGDGPYSGLIGNYCTAMNVSGLWLIALLLLATPASAQTQPEPHTVRIHFHRANPDYSGWGLHLWGDGLKLNRPYSWTEPYPPSGVDDYGVYFDIALQPGAKTFGFVLHMGEQKNAPYDQYWLADQHGPEVWLLEGSGTLYTERPAVAPQAVVPLKRGPLASVPLWAWYLAVSLIAIAASFQLARKQARRAELRLQEQASLLTQTRAELASQISQFEANEQRLRQLSGRDELTGLPTRAAIRQVMANIQSRAQRHDNKVAIIFLDLDNFKPINDQYGHAAGDELLKSLAGRFSRIVRESDVVARMGGDEFVVIAEEVDSERAIALIARKLIQAACKPVSFEQQSLQVGCSLGIAVFPSDSRDGDTLLKQADTAMYAAKNAGKGQFRFFSEAANRLCARESELAGLMARAVELQQLRAHELPLLQCQDRAPAGYELYLRWQLGDDELLSARDFIDVAEVTGQLPALGHWLIDQACARATRLAPRQRLSINLWPSQLADPELLACLHKALLRHSLAAERLVFEIDRLPEHPQANTNLQGLCSLGVGLALDKARPDQLTLELLSQLPWCWVKIAAEDHKPAQPDPQRLWRGLAACCRALDIQLVATHLETEAQLEWAEDLGCDLLQGHALAAETPCPLI